MAEDRDITLQVAELSDAGREPTKQVNEDLARFALTAHGFLAVVCDGMGGHSYGREASHRAVDTIFQEVEGASDERRQGDVLGDAIRAANSAVYALGGDAPMGMRPGSTCVATLIQNGEAMVAHVGDSRAYLVREGAIYRLTRDHSVVQHLVDAGMIAAHEAASHPDSNRITRALGMSPEVDVEVAAQPLPLGVGDILVLCTDGLTDLVREDEILRSLSFASSALDAACRQLVELANARAGHDNITVQLIRVSNVRDSRPRGHGPPESTDHARDTELMSEQAITENGTDHDTLIDPGAAPTLIATPASAEHATLTEPRAGGAYTQAWNPGTGPNGPTAPEPGRPRIATPTDQRYTVDPASRLQASQGRLIFWLAVAVAAVIVATVALWWAFRSVN
jgi:serine/threonine protein phosphatase PrpC